VKRKLFFIIPTLTQGGAERVIITLINHLDKNEFEISLLVVSMKDEVYKYHIPRDVKLVDLKKNHVRSALPKIIFTIWKYKPHIVMSTIGYLNLAIAMVRFILPLKTYFVARETIVVSQGLQRVNFPRIWKFWYRYYYPYFDKIICQSEDMMNDLASLLNYDKNLVLINNPVDYKSIQNLASLKYFQVDQFFDDKLNVYFVAAGRLLHQKGFDLLIEAIALVDNPRVKLAILGHGPLQKSLEMLIESFCLQNQVILVGYQENPYAWISRADAFILSSYYEGFPNVVLEALACNTQVISTPAPGGTREILQNIEGCFLSENINSSSLADAISLFINSNRVNISEKAIEPYKVKKITQQYENLFCELTDN